VKKKRSFWDDDFLGPKLDAIPENELSTIIRMALRDYFNLTDSKKGIIGYAPVEPISTDMAKTVAEESISKDAAINRPIP